MHYYYFEFIFLHYNIFLECSISLSVSYAFILLSSLDKNVFDYQDNCMQINLYELCCVVEI